MRQISPRLPQVSPEPHRSNLKKVVGIKYKYEYLSGRIFPLANAVGENFPKGQKKLIVIATTNLN